MSSQIYDIDYLINRMYNESIQTLLQGIYNDGTLISNEEYWKQENSDKRYISSGYMLESSFKIILLSGLTSFGKINLYSGNIHNLKLIKNYREFINMKINTASSSGETDITFSIISKDGNETFFFVTSKYYIEEKDLIDNYGLERLQLTIDKSPLYNNRSHIIMLVKNKKLLMLKIKNTKNKTIINILETKRNKLYSDSNILGESDNTVEQFSTLENGIFDINDLEKWLNLIKNDDREFQTLCQFKKDSLQLRFHQYLIAKEILINIQNKDKLHLIGCVPRSGKSYICAYIIRKLKKNCLIFSNKPNEIENNHKNYIIILVILISFII